MDAAVLSTISALGGTAVGSISSLFSTWMSTQAQARAARLAVEREKRETVYARFMEELATLYANALSETGVDYTKLTTAFALTGRIALYASDPVDRAAQDALRFVVDLALGPRLDPAEMRAMMDRREANVIGAFAQSCRDELRALDKGVLRP